LPALKIPLSIDRITLYGQGFSQSVWVHHTLIENTDKVLSSNMTVSRDDETVILSMDKMRLREVRPEHLKKLLSAEVGKTPEELMEIQWTGLDIKDNKPGDLGDVLVVGASESLQAPIKEHFPSAAFADVGNFQDHASNTIIYLGAVSRSSAEAEMDVLNDALLVAQGAIDKKPKNIWWITCGTQAVGEVAGYVNAGLWGMARTFRLEERAVRLRCLDLDASTSGGAVVLALKSWLGVLSSASLEAENEIAVRPSPDGSGEQAFAARLARSTAEPCKAMCLQMSSRGSLNNLRPVPQETRRKPESTEAEIRVRAIGLNFRDVLNVMASIQAILGHQARMRQVR
jgi:hypothetical protein